METSPENYSCAIIGGGVAGLALAIQLADAGIKTIVFEKNTYPFHKVCGEYISMESWNFLTELGLPLADMQLPIIREVGISSEKGFMLHAPLALGGFGISRYTLDKELSMLARQKGVTILEHCKVQDVKYRQDQIAVVTTEQGSYRRPIILLYDS